MNVIKKLLFTVGIILSFTNILLGTEVLAYYENDITPPWGRIYVEKSVPRDGISYVGSNTVTTRIYANDDICKDEEIKYYISTEEISDTSKLADNLWKTYKAGESTEITLDEDGTKKIYAIFKDANGNTSLIYEEDASNTQNIVFDANGGFGVPENINTTRVHGMSYILPTDAPYKRGYTFLGWSTDSKATVPSYREGDAVPPDASLGTEDETTLYAIYGTDLSSFPDLVDVVEVGDYVNYPVYYDNVVGFIAVDGSAFPNWKSKLYGWRVLSKDEEEGTVTLVSAGVPLRLYRSDAATAQSIASRLSSPSGFFNTQFSSTRIDGYYTENGFKGNNSLKEVFTNKYTVINSAIPEVRAMTKDDVDYLYQYFGETTATTTHKTPINDKKYKEMIAIPSITDGYSAWYWLATVYDSVNLWYVNGEYNQVDNRGRTGDAGIRPVVTLKANVKAIGQNLNGAWDIGIEGRVVQKPTTSETTLYYNEKEQKLNLTNLDLNKVNVTGIVSATEPGKYEVTLSLKDTAEYTWVDVTKDDIFISWKIDIPYGEFIEYGIEYTDIYTNYQYSGDEGWRILSKIDNEDGTSNIEIISTGIPAKMLCSHEGTSAAWCGSQAQIAQYGKDYYSLTSTYESMKIASGLMYNFEKISFKKGTGTPAVSGGLYTAISGNQETGIFRASNLTDKEIRVRSVMHADLVPESAKAMVPEGYTCVERAQGLFTLQNLSINPHSNSSYWLASPLTQHNIERVMQNGVTTWGNRITVGVRPVVSISNVQVVLEDGMWKIK